MKKIWNVVPGFSICLSCLIWATVLAAWGCSVSSKELAQIKKPAKYKITLEWDAVCTEAPSISTYIDGSFSIKFNTTGNHGQMKSFTMTCDGAPVELPGSGSVQAEKPETKP